MRSMGYRESRRRCAEVLDSVVILALGEYQSMRETLYLMRSPVNPERLRESIAQLEAVRGEVREAVDLN